MHRRPKGSGTPGKLPSVKDFLWDFFREEEEMRHASFIEDWLEKESLLARQEGLQQGLQQGLRQGRMEGTAQSVRKVILKRFGVIPPWLQKAPDGWTAEQEEFETRAKKLLGL